MSNSICPQCVGEYGLEEYIRAQGESGECSYCEKESAHVADSAELIEFIVECINRHYEDPAEEVGYCSAEGGYLLPTMDSRELLEEVGLTSTDSDFADEVVDELDVCAEWVQISPYASRFNEQLMYDWRDFSNQVKHATRYTFFKTKVEHFNSGDTAVSQPYQVMSLIGGVIQRLNAFRILEVGETLYRARRHSNTETVSEAKDIGPAPREKAKQNRMTPAGISAFYGAFDTVTAATEARSGPGDDEVTVGRFKAMRQLRLIDLSRINLSDTIFVKEPVIHHEEVRFLKTFRNVISKPIELDDRIHTEYVPTQVLTEFFRYLFKPERRTVHGLIYPSSVSPGGENIVIFCDDLLGTDRFQIKNRKPWIKFIDFVPHDSVHPSPTEPQGKLL
jgi:hypothetical protein